MRARMVLGGLVALTSAAAPAAALSPAEAALAARIPGDVRQYCATDTTPPDGASATLMCDLPTSQGMIVQYEQFASYADAERRYRSIVFRSRTRPDFGNCTAGRYPSDTLYLRDDVPAGRVGCVRTRTTLIRVTLDAGTAIVWWALRPDADRVRLISWWRQHGIGGDSAPAVATTGALFPDALERALLLDIGRSVAASGCVRPRQSGAWIAALRCPLGTGGQVTYRRYETAEDAQADYTLSLGALGITERTGGACDGAQDTEQYYGAPPSGRFACTTASDGRALLQWIDFGRAIRGIAVAPRRQSALRDWWRTQPR